MHFFNITTIVTAEHSCHLFFCIILITFVFGFAKKLFIFNNLNQLVEGFTYEVFYC